jgi:predicted signal transduction protein with EAL and GGDEF domain
VPEDAGETFAGDAATGIRKVIEGDQNFFYLEYPCHSNTEKRWFMMRVTPLELGGQQSFVISHKNITERKLAEIEAMNLSRIDWLTGIANRRSFDEHLESEWKRCERLRLPLSLILLDIDYFKLFNDTLGTLPEINACRKLATFFRCLERDPVILPRDMEERSLQ